ncbi:hypothetical protein GCM10010503_18150 [Streptomyces lucensis JCM 4490]|uniref:Uncharacterized protein n=1 Tax=Streptomyces lucensis JCM 4490 TaxID=1306176 RepID=A0A918MPG8_9ACTN|nr:hypothetical protein GCM10010503_18150 [Streptomyces lucensis JCM 4490]
MSCRAVAPGLQGRAGADRRASASVEKFSCEFTMASGLPRTAYRPSLPPFPRARRAERPWGSLERFRPAGTPGASATGVPAGRGAEGAAEPGPSSGRP